MMKREKARSPKVAMRKNEIMHVSALEVASVLGCINKKSLWQTNPIMLVKTHFWCIKVRRVGTPPLGKHVARGSWWRVARVISRTIIIRIPLKICMVRLSYPEPLKERQTTFQASPIQGRANDAGRA